MLHAPNQLGWIERADAARLVVGRANVRAVLPAVHALMADASLPLKRVVTARVRWDEAPEAWLAPATKLVVERC